MPERLTNAQREFLRALEKEWTDEQKSAQRLASVPPLVLARWLEAPPFKRRLRLTLRALRCRREIAVVLSGARASERLCAEMSKVASLKSAAELRACLELIKLVDARERKPVPEEPSEREERAMRRREKIHRELFSGRLNAKQDRALRAEYAELGRMVRPKVA